MLSDFLLLYINDCDNSLCQELKLTSEAKYLDSIFDDHPQWTKHLDYVLQILRLVSALHSQNTQLGLPRVKIFQALDE